MNAPHDEVPGAHGGHHLRPRGPVKLCKLPDVIVVANPEEALVAGRVFEVLRVPAAVRQSWLQSLAEGQSSGEGRTERRRQTESGKREQDCDGGP